ncbi:uncharacterized protein LOC124342847 [Daphnia pulicaria]|uniref:uncharacterized protein LOC124342847 n=1 Tax=Daphnia pulicaria TaxID=35523 RepID=UPI001EEB1409|nr:uncharacterized protein LOC124342847 [Daphnia pulicaria]
MNSGMVHLATWLLLIVGGSLVVESRTVRLLANSLPTSVNKQQPTAGRHPLTAEIKGQHNDKRVSSSPYTHQGGAMDGSKLFDGLTLATYGTKNFVQESGNNNLPKLKNRQGLGGAFSDFGPYMGKFIYKLFVRRALIKPMVKGMKRLIPGTMYHYYNDIMSSNRVFKMMEPLSPAISSYTYNKFEQGIFWSLNRAGSFVMDNFIEFER